MTLREKIKIFRIKFKELKKRKKASFVIFVMAFIGVCVCLVIIYQLIKDIERWKLNLLGLFVLYEVPMLYQFAKRMSAKEKELNRIMRKQMSFKDTKEALHNYDFVTVPEIIFEAFLEKSSTIVLLFVNYLLLLASNADAQDLFQIYSSLLIICLMAEGSLKFAYISTKKCGIFMDISFCRNRKIHSLLKEALNSKFR